ncbi:MAG: RagB/SusD family nutrient uptake outer membrane protein [Alistipes shahii]
MSASSDYYEFWSHFYRGIRSATYFIQHIGDNQEMLNDPTRGPLVVEQYKNEARFLRAWFYYNLLRQYGPLRAAGRRGAARRPRPRRRQDEPAPQLLRRVRGLYRRRTGHHRQRTPAAALHLAGRQATTAARRWPCAWGSRAACCCWRPARSSTGQSGFTPTS